MLNVTHMAIMLSVIILSVIMLSVIMLSVIMLNVAFSYCYAECRYANVDMLNVIAPNFGIID
jgi:hypothetical protein